MPWSRPSAGAASRRSVSSRASRGFSPRRRGGFCDATVVAAFVSVAGYRGNVALTGTFSKLVDALIASGKPVTLVALGNPYLLRSFPKVSAYLTTYSTVAPAETAAVKALVGEIPIRGHLPITIPDIAKYG